MSIKKLSKTEQTFPFGELSEFCEPLEEHKDLPVLILPKIVLFPGQMLPISSLEGLTTEDIQNAHRGTLRVGVIADTGENDPQKGRQLSTFGTEAIITGLIRLSEGHYGAILKGVRRLFIRSIEKRKNSYYAHAFVVGDRTFKRTTRFVAEAKTLKSLVTQVMKFNASLPQETMALLYSTDESEMLIDLITPYLSISTKEKIAILSNFSVRSRVSTLIRLLTREVELLQISTKIQDDVRSDLQENLKRNFLREQIQAIKRELGELDGEESDEDDLVESFEKIPLTKEARDSVEKEIDRLSAMHPGSPEYSVAWTFLGNVKDLPWASLDALQNNKSDRKKASLATATRVLNNHHYGLKKVKERVLEFIAVLQHKGKLNGQILLLHGPPGVGKTSLVKSIAEALGRPFAKVSLGGVRDEAEIRGHRRTYIGAMPGRIMQAIKTSQAADPVILLDEIDKVGVNTHGQSDLSSALLEALDPEQNKNFSDHYFGFSFDLSNAIFFATANTTDTISHPLLDRMEILDLSGYTESEKVHIALGHIIPKAREEFNLTPKQFDVEEDLLRRVIRDYTREAGVRQLSREVSAMGRKVVKNLVTRNRRMPLSNDTLVEYLGQPRFFEEPRGTILTPGVAIGLAYTVVGGDIMYIEARRNLVKEGKGSLSLTGSLGKVMQESAQTVSTFILTHAEALGLNVEEVERSNVHIHFPDGATSKDGPSAGLAILSTLVSLFKGIAYPSDLAMTGEATLRGKALPVGGIKEKLLAAHRYGKKRVIIPRDNWLDLDELPAEVLNDLEIYPVEWMSEALAIAGLIDLRGQAAPKPAKSMSKLRLQRLPATSPTSLAPYIGV
jgi:ATP-dependent Lon protease